MSKVDIVHIINKRNRAVFAVPLKDARELMDNFEGLLETQEALPEEPKPEMSVNPDELKILGGGAETADAGQDKDMSGKVEEPKTQETLPEEPKPEKDKAANPEIKVKTTLK